MMLLQTFFLFSLFWNPLMAAEPIKKKVEEKVEPRGQDLRTFIGSTFSPPVAFEGKIYFVATTGVLYEGAPDLSTVTKLFIGKKQTLGNLTLHDGILFWGEGLHTDTKTVLYSFDIKMKKVKEIPVEGHIERAPFISEGVLYTGLGPQGVAAFKADTLQKLWQTKEIEKKAIHADGNIVSYKGDICTTSIYDFKAIICMEAKTGKISQSYSLKKNPKSEIVLTKDYLVGIATEADMTKPVWTLPSNFYVVDLAQKKIHLEKELRGFNYFAPLIDEDVAYVTLSTGEFLSLKLSDGKIGYIGEFQEPFINNAFFLKEAVCSLGVMGKLLCYSKGKSTWGLSSDKRYMESPIGKTALVNGSTYAPSRVGYFLVEP
ncbi:MAG: hypothetical protein ACOYL6_14500 [Bacteriovoracaceae bacterium]